jgi:hypothetical protein
VNNIFTGLGKAFKRLCRNAVAKLMVSQAGKWLELIEGAEAKV